MWPSTLSVPQLPSEEIPPLGSLRGSEISFPLTAQRRRYGIKNLSRIILIGAAVENRSQPSKAPRLSTLNLIMFSFLSRFSPGYPVERAGAMCVDARNMVPVPISEEWRIDEPRMKKPYSSFHHKLRKKHHMATIDLQ